MTEIPRDNSFNPNHLYDLGFLAYKWGYKGDLKNLRKSLTDEGATIYNVGKGRYLVWFGSMLSTSNAP